MLRTVSSKGNLTISEQREDWAAVRHELYSLALTHHRPLQAIYEKDVNLRFLANRDNELWLPLLSLAKSPGEAGSSGAFGSGEGL